MSFENLRTLSLNPFMSAKIIQNFLEGYDSPADITLLFYVLPIIMSKESRDILSTAKSTSRIETLFGAKRDYGEAGNLKLPGRVTLAGFLDRFEHLKELTRLTIIVLSNENKIDITNSIVLLQKNNFSKYSGNLRATLKAAFYLGVVFRKTTYENFDKYLGVNRAWKAT